MVYSVVRNPCSVAVTGITGHVGRELTRQLKMSGFEVHGLTRRELSKELFQDDAITLHRIDGCTETLVRLFQMVRPMIVIHLAALARRSHLAADLIPFVEANILFGTQILEASRLSGCKRFITAESVLQYSDFGEFHPVNLYAATKQAFANVLHYYVDSFDLDAIALVLPTVYSEFERDRKLMTDTAYALQKGTLLELHTSNVLIDFVHVEDVANAFVTAALKLQEKPDHSTGVLRRYCISSGEDVTPLDLVAMFERIGEGKISVKVQESRENSRRRSPWHGPTLPMWSPIIDLETGIRRMLSAQR